MTWRYMPILKWKRGEQFALRHLTAAQWEGVVPLLELQSIGAAPDMPSIRDALPDYSAGLMKSFEQNIPAAVPVFIDTRYVAPSAPRQLGLLLVLSNYLATKLKREIHPVIPLAHLPELVGMSAAQRALLSTQAKVALRLRIDQYEPEQTEDLVRELVLAGVPEERIQIIVDQFGLVGRKGEDCHDTVVPYLDAALAQDCAGVTLAGGSFPADLTGIKTGVKDLARVEWAVWQLLQANGYHPTVLYADYAVTNPAPQPDLDPRTVNPSIAIRYALHDRWRVFKGKGFKSGAKGEYKALCELLTTEVDYSGSGFSYGDAEMQKAAAGPGASNGSPWTWRREATNHHIVLTRSFL